MHYSDRCVMYKNENTMRARIQLGAQIYMAQHNVFQKSVKANDIYTDLKAHISEHHNINRQDTRMKPTKQINLKK